MKPLLLAAVGLTALHAAHAQDLNPISDTAIVLPVSSTHYWARSVTEHPSPVSLEVRSYGSLDVEATIPLPVERVGDVLSVPIGADEWHVLVLGAITTPGTHALPDVDGVLAILRVVHDAGTWTSTVLDIEHYDDISPWAAAMRADQVYLLDYRTGGVWHSDDFAIATATPEVPSRSQLGLAMAGQPQDPVWMQRVPSSCFRFHGESDAVRLYHRDDPRRMMLIGRDAAGAWTVSSEDDPRAWEGEILIEDESVVGSGSSFQVKIAGDPSVGTHPLTLRDPNGQVLWSQNVTAGSSVTVPASIGLGIHPGEPHTFEWGTTERQFEPAVRYGSSFSPKPGFWIGRGQMATPHAGIPFEHGVRMHAEPQLANEVVTVFAMYGLRTGGVDPVVPLPGGDFQLAASWYETYTNVRLGDLNGSLGDQFDVPAFGVGLVVLTQYAVVFQDGSIAYSDVSGRTARALPE